MVMSSTVCLPLMFGSHFTELCCLEKCHKFRVILKKEYKDVSRWDKIPVNLGSVWVIGELVDAGEVGAIGVRHCSSLLVNFLNIKKLHFISQSLDDVKRDTATRLIYSKSKDPSFDLFSSNKTTLHCTRGYRSQNCNNNKKRRRMTNKRRLNKPGKKRKKPLKRRSGTSLCQI